MSLSKYLFILFMFTGYAIHAQTFEVPEQYVLSVADDYKKYEKDIIAASRWLMSTPMDEQEEKRMAVSEFVMKWVNGSPTVNVEINPTVLAFEKQNKGMLVLFMAGCAQYVLENNYSKDMRAKHKFALRAMADVYRAGKGISIKRDKKMESFIESDEEGKIDKWLEKNLAVKSN